MKRAESVHFEGKEPAVEKIYHKLLAGVKQFGRVGIEPKKTSIHLVSRFAFAGVYLRKDYINLEFHLERKLTSPRIRKVEQASPNRFHHTVRLNSDKDVDRELISWLREAYELKA